MIKPLCKLSILLALGGGAATGTSTVCWSGSNESNSTSGTMENRKGLEGKGLASFPQRW